MSWISIIIKHINSVLYCTGKVKFDVFAFLFGSVLVSALHFLLHAERDERAGGCVERVKSLRMRAATSVRGMREANGKWREWIRKLFVSHFFSIRVESTQVSPIVKFLHPVYRSSCAASRRWIGFNWNCKNKLSFSHLLTLECFKDEGEWNGKTRRRLTDIFIYSLLRSDDKSRTNIWLSMHWNEELGCKCLKTENPSSRFFTLNHFRPLFRLVALNLPCAVLMLLLLLYWCMISILKLYPLSTLFTLIIVVRSAFLHFEFVQLVLRISRVLFAFALMRIE